MHILRFTFYRLARCILSCQIFIFFSVENDDMESSKRSVKLLLLIFIIRCLTKSNLIRTCNDSSVFEKLSCHRPWRASLKTKDRLRSSKHWISWAKASMFLLALSSSGSFSTRKTSWSLWSLIHLRNFISHNSYLASSPSNNSLRLGP